MVKFYNSAAWRKVRDVMLKRFPICADCEVMPSTEVHHKVKAKTRTARLAFANLMALCKRCHAKRSGRGE